MTTPTDPQQDEKPVAAIRPGSWPQLCVQRAFVDGAVWHQWSTTGSTPWSHERDAYEDEAVKRYGEPDVDLQQLRERHEALVSALQESVEKLTWVRKFVEYARYELEPGVMQPGDQFPRQDAADKAVAELDSVIVAITEVGAK
jgi:hypothetical protein